MVDIAFIQKFDAMVTLEQLKRDAQLQGMMVTKKGSRLSIQPVQDDEFSYIMSTYLS